MGNVLKLPTAAPRQVKQRSVKAVRAYKAANPWPGEYIPNHVRARQADDALLEDMQRSPELLLVMALLSYADEATRRKVLAVTQMAILSRPECPSARQANYLARRLAGELSAEARVINTAILGKEGD